METKHTQGEWKVTKTHFNYYVVDENESSICQLNSRDDEKANAKLIAAAPELLEALIDAQKLIEKHLPNELTAHDLINNAINKATK